MSDLCKSQILNSWIRLMDTWIYDSFNSAYKHYIELKHSAIIYVLIKCRVISN